MKILSLFFTFMVLYLVNNKCNIEGILNLRYNTLSQCKDDPSWYVTDKDGKKHTCKDIGKTASCYDIDVVNREGWERCLKTCGNCTNTTVSKMPMNVMATFSGDPIEAFGVVLHTDKDRQWVGKSVGKGKGDIRAYVDMDKGKDMEDLRDRLDSVESVFDLITGNVKSCRFDKSITCNRAGDNKNFQGCNGTCLTCPSPDSPSPSKKHTYIKKNCPTQDKNKSNCTIEFPAIEIACKNIKNVIPSPNKDICNNYFLFDKISADQDDKDDYVSKAAKENKNKITLYDMCPKQCGVEACKKT